MRGASEKTVVGAPLPYDVSYLYPILYPILYPLYDRFRTTRRCSRLCVGKRSSPKAKSALMELLVRSAVLESWWSSRANMIYMIFSSHISSPSRHRDFKLTSIPCPFPNRTTPLCLNKRTRTTAPTTTSPGYTCAGSRKCHSTTSEIRYSRFLSPPSLRAIRVDIYSRHI